VSSFPALPFPIRYLKSVALDSILPQDTTLRYEQLPPMPPLSDDLSWITPLPKNSEMEKAGKFASDVAASEGFSKIVDQREQDALQLGLTLPPAWLNLVRSPQLIQRLPDPVFCYFYAGRIRACPQTANGFILPFLGDPQTSCAHYLYLTPSGDEAVLFAEEKIEKLYDEKISQMYGGPEQILENFLTTVSVCYPTFKEFLYRHWMENRMYFKIGWGETDEEREATFTKKEAAYLAFVRQAIHHT
jgi:hypothetical protein